MIQKFLKRVGAVALALVTVGVVGCGSADVNMVDGSIPRAEASQALDVAFDNYLEAVKTAGQDLHSIMIVKDGKVVKEQWLSEGAPDKLHILNSVSTRKEKIRILPRGEATARVNRKLRLRQTKKIQVV